MSNRIYFERQQKETVVELRDDFGIHGWLRSNVANVDDLAPDGTVSCLIPMEKISELIDTLSNLRSQPQLRKEPFLNHEGSESIDDDTLDYLLGELSKIQNEIGDIYYRIWN